MDDNITGIWRVSGSDGVFISSLGFPVTSIQGADHVLYLPPRDMPLGSSVVDDIYVQVTDTGGAPGFSDSPLDEHILVTTTHEGSGAFSVQATWLGLPLTQEQPPPCPQTDGLCRLTLGTSNYLGPFVTIIDYPQNGMSTGQMRMLMGSATDLDKIEGECGTPPGISPASSNNPLLIVNDLLTYNWSVVAGPGGGVFVMQGTSCLFLAGNAGNVTIRLTVSDASGESSSTEVSFEVKDPRLKEISFKELPDLRYSVWRDLDSSLYNFPEWRDGNDDGDAVDPQGTGDRRFPLAYRRGTTVAISEAKVAVTGVVPEGALIRATGSLPTNSTHMFAGACLPQGSPPGSPLVSAEMICSTALPNWVTAFVDTSAYSLHWEISFGGDLYVPCGNSENALYVTAAKPGLGASLYESVYFVGCNLESSPASEPQVLTKVWKKFADKDIHRKPIDGYNVLDNALLVFWDPMLWDDAPVVAPPNTLPSFMNEPNGNGDCHAFAKLFREAMLINSFTTFPKWTELRNSQGDGLYFLINSFTPNLSYGMIVDRAWDPSDDAFANIIDLSGIAGQGTANPLPIFTNHAVLLDRSGMAYDPSYGLCKASTLEHQIATIFAIEGAASHQFHEIGFTDPLYPGDIGGTITYLPKSW